MELILLVLIGIPALFIWGFIKFIKWLIKISERGSEGKEGTGPLPYYIKTQLDEIKHSKKRILFWHTQGKISTEEFRKLDTLCNEDMQLLLGKLRKEETGVQDAGASAQRKSEIPNVPEPAFPPIRLAEPDKKYIQEEPEEIKTTVSTVVEKQSSPFLSEHNIKLMLYIGVALFVLGASIFVRNNWDIIPGTLKFASLLFVTVATYLTGFFLTKNNKIPKTATALIFLGSVLIPYNFFAVNNFTLLGFKTDWRQVWLLSSIVCLPLYIFNCRLLSSRAFFYGSLVAYGSIIHFGSRLSAVPTMYHPAAMTIACAMIPLAFINYLQKKGVLAMSTSIFDAHVFVNIISLISFIQLIVLGAARGNDIWTGIGFLIICSFYMLDTFIIDDKRMLYAAGISFYTAVLMFILNFNQPFLSVVAVISTMIVLVELFFRYVHIAGREGAFFKPFNDITQIIASVTAIGIFTMEISRFIATYFFDYNLTLSIVYQLRTMIWITAAGLVYFVLLQLREQKKIYSHILIGYFYIFGFIVMQVLMDVTYHAYGFMLMGAMVLVTHKYLSQGNSNETLFGPLKSFSYLFTTLMTVYLVMRYIVSASSMDDYILALMRMSGLLLYFGLALYLYWERVMIYIVSFLFYAASFIIVVNLMGLNQHALFFSLATLPVFGLYCLNKDKEYSHDLLMIETAALTVSFGISLLRGFYIFPLVAVSGGYYFYNLVSLCIILTISLIHEFSLKKRELGYVSGVLFYLVIFVAAYPHVSIQGLGIIMTFSSLLGVGLSLLLSKKDDLAGLGDSLALVSHVVQFIVIGIILGTLSLQPGNFGLVNPAYVMASLLYGAIFIFSEKDIYAYLAQLLFGLAYFSVLKYVPSSNNYWSFHLLLLNILYIGCGRFCSVFKEDIDTRPFKYMGLVTMILALLFSLNHLEYAYIIFGSYAFLCFIWSIWEEKSFWRGFSYNLLLAAYELMILNLRLKTVEFYTMPLGLVLLGWGIAFRKQADRRNFLYTLGVLVIYIPGLFSSMSETWGLHGVFLGCIALVLLFVGVKMRSKIIVSYSAVVLVVNGIIQSHSFMLTIPRWVYMATGGTLLIVSSMLFEMKREALVQMGRNLADKWRDWE